MTNPLPPDLGELWKALRIAWLADPFLVQLIDQTADGGSIYVSMPHNKIPFPLLVMKIQDPDINTQASFLGVSHETIQVNAYSLDRYFGEKIFAAFQANWSIPITAVEFTSSNWRITNMIWSHPIDLGQLRVTNQDQDLWGFACQCRCYVRRRDS